MYSYYGIPLPLVFSTRKIIQLHVHSLTHTNRLSYQHTYLLRRLRRPLGSQNFHPCPRNDQG